MTDKCFLDSNVVIYALGDDPGKKKIAQDLLSGQPTISTQVLTEVSQVCLRKLKLDPQLVIEWIGLLQAETHVTPVSAGVIQQAIKISARTGYSFYDSLILSAGIASGATILYSEDMQHGQDIDGLTIMNPFRSDAA